MSIFSYVNYLRPSNYIAGKSSEHFNNASSYFAGAATASAEAVGYATKSAGNITQVGKEAFVGATSIIAASKEAYSINVVTHAAAAAAPTVAKPLATFVAHAVTAGLILAVQYPLAAVGLGALAGAMLSPEYVINAAKNMGNTIYKVGETALDLIVAGSETAVGAALYTEETIDICDQFLRPQGSGLGTDGNMFEEIKSFDNTPFKVTDYRPTLGDEWTMVDYISDHIFDDAASAA